MSAPRSKLNLRVGNNSVTEKLPGAGCGFFLARLLEGTPHQVAAVRWVGDLVGDLPDPRSISGRMSPAPVFSQQHASCHEMSLI